MTLFIDLTQFLAAYPKETIASAAIIGGGYIAPLMSNRVFAMKNRNAEGKQ